MLEEHRPRGDDGDAQGGELFAQWACGVDRRDEYRIAPVPSRRLFDGDDIAVVHATAVKPAVVVGEAEHIGADVAQRRPA